MSHNRILLVEEDTNDIEQLRFLFERSSCLLPETGVDQMGLDVACHEVSVLILTDPFIPEVEGWTVAGNLKSDPETTSIFPKSLTYHNLHSDSNKPIDSGFDGYISNPINNHGHSADIV